MASSERQALGDRQVWPHMGLLEVSSRSGLELLSLWPLVETINYPADRASRLVYRVLVVRQMVIAWGKARQTR